MLKSAPRRKPRSSSSNEIKEGKPIVFVPLVAGDSKPVIFDLSNENNQRVNDSAEIEPKQLNSYEKQRLENIERNHQFMMQLGLGRQNSSSDEMVSVDGDVETGRRRRRSSTGTLRKVQELQPLKRSKRLAGEKGPDFVDVEESERRAHVLNAVEPQTVAPTPEALLDPDQRYSHTLWFGRKQTNNITATFAIPAEIYAPLTLCSIGTTILELGSIVTGRDKHLYWSGKAAMFKHPYPVGYRAVKSHFKHRYFMAIFESDDGPVFEVKQEGGRAWRGQSPTTPWTEVCLVSHAPNTRVSGPLFFGFSDPITQKLIEGLPGYEPWAVIQEHAREVRRQQMQQDSQDSNMDE